jgi:hypothetical protein
MKLGASGVIPAGSQSVLAAAPTSAEQAKQDHEQKELEYIKKHGSLPNERKQLAGAEGGTANFGCPVKEGVIIYGAQGKTIPYVIPRGTTSIQVNNSTMGGDPIGGVSKEWIAGYTCEGQGSPSGPITCTQDGTWAGAKTVGVGEKVYRGNEIATCRADGSWETSTAPAPAPANVSFRENLATSTEWNDEGGGNSAFLDRHNISCPSGPINGLRLRRKGDGKFRYDYTCAFGGNLGNPITKDTGLNDTGGGNSVFLDRHNIDCGSNAVISRLQLANIDGKMRYDYTCLPSNSKLTLRGDNTGDNDAGGGNSMFLDRHTVKCRPNEALNRLYLASNNGKIRYDYTCASTESAPAPAPAPAPVVETLQNGIYSIKGGKDNKFCADDNDNMRCNRDGAGGWEKFNITKDGDRYTIRGGRENKLCADDNDTMRCNRDGVGSWERFDIKKDGDRYTIRGGRNNKLCADEGGRIICDRDGVGSWERFDIRPA